MLAMRNPTLKLTPKPVIDTLAKAAFVMNEKLSLQSRLREHLYDSVTLPRESLAEQAPSTGRVKDCPETPCNERTTHD